MRVGDDDGVVAGPPRPEMSRKLPLALLLLGGALLWPVPVGGALLMVAAGVGLAISLESDLMGVVPARALDGPVTD